MFATNRLKSDGDQKIGRYFNMVKLFYQNKDYTTAKNYVNELLSLKPDSSEAYKLLSQINEAMGEHEQAMLNYKKSLDLKVNYDLNSSYEHNHQFTPTKISSPLANKINQENSVGNHSNHVAHDNLEKLFEQKTALFEKSFESINQQLSQLNDNFNKNYEEVSSFKKKIVDMQKRLTYLTTKQDEIVNKLSALSMKDNDNLKEQLSNFSANLINLTNDNSKIIDELFSLKEIVTTLRDLKSDLSHYDEESYNEEDDDEIYEQTNEQPMNLGPKPNLNELCKPQKDAWKCSTCETPNAASDSACVCCETPNPNLPKPQVNGLEPSNNSGGSPFKFGVSVNPPKFNFGIQPTQGTSPAFPAFGNLGSNVVKPVVSSTPATTLLPFGGIANSSSNLPTNQNITPSSISTPPSVAPFSSNFSIDPSKFPKATTTPTIFGSPMPISNALNPAVTAKSNAATSVPSTNFSFTGTLNTAKVNDNAQTKSTTVSTTVSTGLTFPPVNGTSFPFNNGVATNSNSIFSNPQPSGSFAFGSIPLSSNLFSQKPSFMNEVKSEQKDKSTVNAETEVGDKEHNLENGGDSTQDGDYFKLPEVKMPDNYEQVTGEEDESVVFEKKSKLYIHKDGEYKERGIGIMKILKHNKTLKYRVLMRRDHIFKVCLNAHLTDITKLELVDNKFLRFSCIDFSEDKPDSGVFLLKFGNVESLSEFKKLIESLAEKKADSPKTISNQPKTTIKKEEDKDSDVVLVFTKEPKPEHLAKISSLQLPVNFYDYEDKEACKGCIGCKDDSVSWNELTRVAEENCKTDEPDASNSDTGLFSSIATDLNLTENKIDSITANDSLDNDHANDQNFVSEKSKLLPQNFEAKTGEENEDIIFNERGKMFHFVNGEWKERGIGFMKILNQRGSNTYRLLMRRDKILNVICNHKISANLKLEPFQNSNNTLTWFSRDYSEEANGIDELFALKFKNEALMNQFEKSVNESIEKSSA